MKILVVDDEPSVRTLISIQLSRRGYQVIEADSGIAALEAVRTQDPDLVLCDYMMEEMDGYEVLLALREDPKSAKIPFVLMTGFPKEAGLLMGGDGQEEDAYLKKPFQPNELLRVVESRLAKAKV